MRLALASLILSVAIAPLALAQPTTDTPPPPAAPAAPPAATEPAPPPAATTPPPPEAAPPAPAAPATPPAAPTTAPAAPPPATSPLAPAAAPEAPAAAPAAPAEPVAEAPPAPPPPPTDPTAIALISTLEKVCIPAAAGGPLPQLAKTGGFRKSGDNFVNRTSAYQLTIEAPGSNPNQCRVDIVHPIDPAAPIIVALHNWAAVDKHWTLYRNDKNVQGAVEYTTRSWEHDVDGGSSERLVFTTMRKADGTSSQKNADTSVMIYSFIKTP